MRHPAGVSTGALIGSIIEADGIRGNAALFLLAPRSLFTSGSIPGTGIPGWSNSTNCVTSTIVISHETVSSVNTIISS